MANNKKNLTIIYAAVQFSYWFLFGAVNNFASVYLLSSGFKNTAIGLVAALGCSFAVLLQPLIASYADRDDSPSLKTIIIFIDGLILFIGAGLFLAFGGSMLINGLLFLLAILLTQVMTPLINALGTESIGQGNTLNFSFARAFGSIGYAVMSYTLGYMVELYGAVSDPVCISAIAAVLFILAFFYPFRKIRKGAEHSAAQAGKGADIPESLKKVEEDKGFFRKYRSFVFSLFGCVLIYISHIYLNNFTYQIVVSKGGNSEEMGTAMAIASASELIVMFIFPLMLRKKGPAFWFRLSGVFFTLKALGTFLAPNMGAFFAVQAFQPMGWGLLTVASVFYVDSIMDERDKIKGQAYMTMSYSIGNVLGSLSGGVLLDMWGTQGMLIAAIISGLIGTVVVMAR